jgi:hypothetical protein
VTSIRPPESKLLECRQTLSRNADDWIRQFIKHFELHVLDARRNLPRDASIAESQAATARAILATYLDSGMEFESAVELLGRVTVEWRSGD